MNESNPQAEKPQNKHRFDPELLKKGFRCDLDQYEMLKRCSDKKDITEWNQWRKEHSNEEILLEGANLKKFWLEGVNFRHASLKEANFYQAKLKEAEFNFAILKGTTFIDANLESTIFYGAHLQNANFRTTLTNGTTSFWGTKVNENTMFLGVALDSIRIDPGKKQLLEYNIRRQNWEAWYKYKNWQESKDERHVVVQKLMWFIRLFWSFSDYGRSTGRIAGWFFILALLFAAIYSNMAFWFPPGIVSNLEIEPHLPPWHYFVLLILRPVYFSIVTMTTLGFGDMYANSQSIWGHILLTFQVILGYVLLGALVTRFAVLFTAGGPAGRFADDNENK